MTLSQKQRLFAKLLAQLIQWAFDNGYEVVIGEVERTEYQQAEYVRTKKSKTMQSSHRDRLAADLFLFVNNEYRTDGESYRPLGEKWESLGREANVKTIWGGRFGVNLLEYQTKVGWDAVHFELAGLTLVPIKGTVA